MLQIRLYAHTVVSERFSNHGICAEWLMSFLVAVRLLQPACTLKIRNWNWKKENMLLIYFDKWVKNQLFLENEDFWEDGRWLRGKKSPNGFFAIWLKNIFSKKKIQTKYWKKIHKKGSTIVVWYVQCGTLYVFLMNLFHGKNSHPNCEMISIFCRTKCQTK